MVNQGTGQADTAASPMTMAEFLDSSGSFDSASVVPPPRVPCWVKGLAFCNFAASEVLNLAERLQRFLGPLACRAASPEQLFTHAPLRQGELLLLPLRHTADQTLVWLYELRQKGVHSPVLFVRYGMDFLPSLPLESLGAVDFISFEDASDFELWRSLGLLKRSFEREMALLELSGELESAQSELMRRRDEVGYLTFSLAGREIDEELTGDRLEERSLAEVRKKIRRSERFGTPLTGLLVGIDEMDRIKKVCGSGFAAFVLVQVAYRLKQALRGDDLLVRFGEHEFLLLSQESSDQAVHSHARRINTAVTSAPLESMGHSIRASISIGAARYRTDMTTTSELLDVVKMALGTAQRRGKGKFILV